MFGVLYIQSAYSMLNNTMPLEKLVKAVKKNGYDFIALSDHQLHGAYQLFKDAKKQGLKAILGLKIDVYEDLYKTSFLVYAKNQQGYKNLLRLAYIKSIDKVTMKQLIQLEKGLIFVSASGDNSIDFNISHDNMQQAYEDALMYDRVFEHFFIGLSLDTLEQEIKIAPRIIEISEKSNIDILPLHQSSYFDASEKHAYEALRQIENQSYKMIEDADYQLLSKTALLDKFSAYPYVFDTLASLVKSIDFELSFPHYEMPNYDTKGAKPHIYLKALAIKGLQKRLANKKVDHHIYKNRLLYELDVIHKMGYDQYFLIVFDFVRYAKQHDILVGPGRGSAAGSLVSYCLGITDIDPITYDLLFERFLNPERITMPDIDMDFPDNKRDEVLKYVQEKYGKHHVISIITFGTFAVKSSLRDLARVMQIDVQRLNGISKRIEDDDVDQGDYELMRLRTVSNQIKGLPRHTGTHAAGVILAKQDLTQSLPLIEGSNGFYQSQFEASKLEKMGLLKIDFLGIRNLTIIHETIEVIHQENPAFNIHQIPLDDPMVYQLLSNADTFGVFQLESVGMRRVLRKYKPKVFEDIIALLALFRPGPMDLIDTFIARKNGEAFTYIHPKLEPILKSTYGIIVYQEQIMKIANEFAGYTLAEADILRRGISKKNADILNKERQRFIDKCLEKQYDKEVATTIYDLIVKFADYGFNRSHSVSYALVAYQMAYLKVNHYKAFMTVLLTHAIGNDKTTYDYINDLRKHNIKVYPPDIQKSTDKYQLVNDHILMPLTKVKSIGNIQINKLLDIRHQPFKDFQDFKQNVKSILNQKNIEMLIYANALSAFGMNQHTLYEHRSFEVAGYNKYIDDFQLRMYKEYPFHVLAEHEKEALGFNLIYHPLVAYHEMKESMKLDELKDIETKKIIKALAFVTKIKEITTKTNKKMAFVTLDDGSTSIETTMFTETYEKYKDLLGQSVHIFELKQNTFKNKVSYIINQITVIKDKHE